jgi:hypothetical protein
MRDNIRHKDYGQTYPSRISTSSSQHKFYTSAPANLNSKKIRPTSASIQALTARGPDNEAICSAFGAYKRRRLAVRRRRESKAQKEKREVNPFLSAEEELSREETEMWLRFVAYRMRRTYLQQSGGALSFVEWSRRHGHEKKQNDKLLLQHFWGDLKNAEQEAGLAAAATQAAAKAVADGARQEELLAKAKNAWRVAAPFVPVNISCRKPQRPWLSKKNATRTEKIHCDVNHSGGPAGPILGPIQRSPIQGLSSLHKREANFECAFHNHQAKKWGAYNYNSVESSRPELSLEERARPRHKIPKGVCGFHLRMISIGRRSKMQQLRLRQRKSNKRNTRGTGIRAQVSQRLQMQSM